MLNGCDWLGKEYIKSIKTKYVTKEQVLNGILAETENWSPKTLDIDFNREKLIKKSKEAWTHFFNHFDNIKNETLVEIIDDRRSFESDAARNAIYKLYTLETPLYSVLNKANCRRDK